MKTLKQSYRIWKPAYRPFIMGGSVHANIATHVTPDEIWALGGKPVVRVGVKTINKKTYVFEVKSGGVVGDSLEAVTNDFASASPAVIRKQIAQAKREGEKADVVTPDEFFNSK